MAGLNTYSANAFADNFMKGFSFVDEIKKSRRSEARLEELLAQQKEEREFQRGRTLEADEQVREDREATAQALERKLAKEGSRRAGDAAAMDPDSSEELLSRYVSDSPLAAAELARRQQTERYVDAYETSRTIPTAGQQPAAGGLADQVTGGAAGGGAATGGPVRPSPQTLQNIADGGATFTPQPAAPVTSAPGTEGTFGPNIGIGSIQEISREDVKASSKRYQDESVPERIATNIGGAVSRVGGALGQGLEAIGSKTIGARPDAATTEWTSSIAGKTFVSDEFVSLEEFKEDFPDASPQEIEIIMARNNELLEDMERKAANSGAFGRPMMTDFGAIQAGGQVVRQAAERQEAAAVRNWRDFAGNPNSKMAELGLANPSAAAGQYLNDRATLVASEQMTPEEVAQIDRRMVPVMDAHIENIELKLSDAPLNSPAHRKLLRTRDNLRQSRNTIAREAPPITEQTDPPINAQGVRVGDAQRTGAVIDTIYDPNRPTYDELSYSQINSAAAVAGRISPNTQRLNRNQVEALATLAEAGYISKPTMQSVMNTGYWPAGKNPATIVGFQKVGENLVVERADGSKMLLPDPGEDAKFRREQQAAELKSRRKISETRAGQMEPTDRTLDDQKVGWAVQGMEISGIRADSANGRTLTKWIWDHAGKVRQGFNVDNQEAMVRLGSVMAQNLLMSDSLKEQYENDWDLFSIRSNADDVLKFDEMMYSQRMREEYADKLGIELIAMPAIENRTGLDIAQLQAAADEGVYGPKVQQAHREGRMEEDDYLWQFFVRTATPDQIRAAQQQAGE